MQKVYKNYSMGDFIMKPLIGITCSYGIITGNPLSSVSTVHMPQEFNQLSNAYVRAVEDAGGVPVIIPLYSKIKNIESLLEVIDGIILSGGTDVSPIMYEQRPSIKLKIVTPLRDKQEIEIVDYINNHKYIPVLGICRGMQILNVALGGSLHQDLESEGFCNHLLNMYPRNYTTHSVVACESSILSSIFGDKEYGVNSFHHQAIKSLGNGLRVVALSSDNVIEAVEGIQKNKFILGIQWHPEHLFNEVNQQEIFRLFIDNCRKGKN